jgi:hypothetical protein
MAQHDERPTHGSRQGAVPHQVGDADHPRVQPSGQGNCPAPVDNDGNAGVHQSAEVCPHPNGHGECSAAGSRIL